MNNNTGGGYVLNPTTGDQFEAFGGARAGGGSAGGSGNGGNGGGQSNGAGSNGSK